MMNTKIFFCGISVLVILAGCMIVNAVAPLFSETRQWQLPISKISVNGQVVTGPIIDMGVVSGEQLSIAYDVANTGNVPITVNVSVVTTGCTASLNATSTTLATGKSAQFVLTLSAFTTPTGQYTITFDKAAPA
jgi:hypothetical protein